MNDVTLIIPDVHEKIRKLKEVLRFYGTVALVVFLGDLLDSWDGLTDATHETCRWIVESTDNPKYRKLWGNHDIHYAYPVSEIISSGFTGKKLKVVQSYVQEKDWNAFRLHTWVGNWLCSHAGWHPTLLHPTKGYDPDALAEIEKQALWNLKHFQMVDPVLKIGNSRGGAARYGGVTWLDWSELEPICGLNQLVGHTEFPPVVRKKETADSVNICIDTGLHEVGLIENGKLRMEVL